MNKGVNIYELMHCFWKENECEPFPTSAIALFFFLLERANSMHWKMPLRCPTNLICHMTGISKQTALTARDTLMQRGLISFQKGTGKGGIPMYVIITDPDKWTESLIDNLTDSPTESLTDNQTDDLTGELTENLTENKTQYNNKDTNIKDNKISINNAVDKKLSLDELERIFLSDSGWHDNLLSLLSPQCSITAEEIMRQIPAFFLNLKCQGVDKREEKDCRVHFINWIRKQLRFSKESTTNKYMTNDISKQQYTDKRRGSGVTATSAREYDGAF